MGHQRGAKAPAVAAERELTAAIKDLRIATRSVVHVLADVADRLPPPVDTTSGRVVVPHRIRAARTTLEMVPGLAAQFRVAVPAKQVAHDPLRVLCNCTAVTVLEPRDVPYPPCSGGCGRFFLPTRGPEGRSVRVAGPYVDEDQVDATAAAA